MTEILQVMLKSLHPFGNIIPNFVMSVSVRRKIVCLSRPESEH